MDIYRNLEIFLNTQIFSNFWDSSDITLFRNSNSLSILHLENEYIIYSKDSGMSVINGKIIYGKKILSDENEPKIIEFCNRLFSVGYLGIGGTGTLSATCMEEAEEKLRKIKKFIQEPQLMIYKTVDAAIQRLYNLANVKLLFIKNSDDLSYYARNGHYELFQILGESYNLGINPIDDYLTIRNSAVGTVQISTNKNLDLAEKQIKYAYKNGYIAIGDKNALYFTTEKACIEFRKNIKNILNSLESK